jgi:hypothetical protein
MAGILHDNSHHASIVHDSTQRYVYETFKGHFHKAVGTDVGGDPTGAAGDVNILLGDRNSFEWHVIGTQTILAPVRTSAGLNLVLDAENNDGIELTLGNEFPEGTIISNVAGATRGTFVVGTDAPFFISFKFSLADVSGADEVMLGLRKAEVYQAVIEDDYDEMAALDVESGDIKLRTILNAGTTAVTDTTDNWADTETKTLMVICDSDGSLSKDGTVGKCYFSIDGVKPTAEATSRFKFDSGEIVIPFFAYRHDSDVCDTIIAKEWESGLLIDASASYELGAA